MGISTTTPFTVIEDQKKHIHCFNKAFSTNHSSSIHFHGSALGTKLFSPHMILGEIDEDYISLPNYDSFKLRHTFLLLCSQVNFSIPIDGIIGMRKYYSLNQIFDGEQYSLIQYFHNKTKLISQPVFALSYKSDGSGRLYFDKDFDNYPKCNSRYVDMHFPYWNCDLTRLNLGEDSIEIERNSVIFDSCKSVITAPMRAGTVILNKIVAMFGDKCFIENDEMYHFLLCSRYIKFEDFPDIILYMNDIKLVLRWKYLFKDKLYQNSKRYISLLAVEHSPREEENNNWVIGIPGFIDNIIIFNYTDGYVGILPEDIISNKELSLIIYIMLVIISIGGIVLIIIAKAMIIK